MARCKKKSSKRWIWIVYDQLGKKPIALFAGKRTKILYEVSLIECGQYSTDDCPGYASVLPWEKHVMGKVRTHCVENFNANVRHYLAGFGRKTRRYSKSTEMAAHSLSLLADKEYTPSLHI